MKMLSERLLVGTLILRLIMRGAFSLKDKRRIIKSLKERIRQKYNVSIAEIAAQDKWREAVIGIACVGNDGQFISSILAQIRNFIGSLAGVEIVGQEQDLL